MFAVLTNLLRHGGSKRSYQAGAIVLDPESELIIPRLGIEIHVQQESMLDDLLIGVCVESLVNFHAPVGHHLPIW